jgi:hypothetical protein
MDEGFGSIDVRLGAVEERRSGPGRAGVGCADIWGGAVWECLVRDGGGRSCENENASFGY